MDHSLPRTLRMVALRASPPLILAAGFLALIALGTILLSLPLAGQPRLSLFQALFMATSAVTVSGLSVIDPATALSTFGQTVLITLVQLGGLGFVTFAVLTSLALGRKLSLRQQSVALQAFNQTNVARIQRTAATVIRMSLTIELIAALVLTLWWWRDMPFPKALGRGLFHAIAAFNNAGFSLFDDSLVEFASDAITLLTISALIILGGIGFSVLDDLWHKRRWSQLMPYTRLIVLGTLVLNLAGFVLLWLLEANNDDTLGALPLHGQALSAWMQSVTARTAGFTSIDITLLHDSSTVVLMILMFIGGGSLSTASGIKVGTFIILLAAVRSYVVQSRDVVLMKRSIEPETIQKSLALVFVTVGFAVTGLFLLTIFEDQPFLDLLFEIVSALSTTGMSRDLTPVLSTPSQAVLLTMMFAGRLGPLTLVYTLATRQHSRVRHPVAQFPVG